MNNEWNEGYPKDDYGWLSLKPGMLVETSDGEQLLVGHVNKMSGTCDCCSEWMSHNEFAFIVRWKYIEGFGDDNK